VIWVRTWTWTRWLTCWLWAICRRVKRHYKVLAVSCSLELVWFSRYYHQQVLLCPPASGEQYQWHWHLKCPLARRQDPQKMGIRSWTVVSRKSRNSLGIMGDQSKCAEACPDDLLMSTGPEQKRKIHIWPWPTVQCHDWRNAFVLTCAAGFRGRSPPVNIQKHTAHCTASSDLRPQSSPERVGHWGDPSGPVLRTSSKTMLPTEIGLMSFAATSHDENGERRLLNVLVWQYYLSLLYHPRQSGDTHMSLMHFREVLWQYVMGRCQRIWIAFHQFPESRSCLGLINNVIVFQLLYLNNNLIRSTKLRSVSPHLSRRDSEQIGWQLLEYGSLRRSNYPWQGDDWPRAVRIP